MKKRALSILLILAFVLAALPQTALMADSECAHEHTAPLSETFDTSRGSFFYMLWLMAGRPEPTLENQYEDLSETDYYYKAALWAVENEITKGISATEFAPDQILTRGQAVTFLWRYAGAPDPESTATPFADLKINAFYLHAVEWAIHTDWIELNADNQYFRPDNVFEGFLLEGTVCEDCGKVIETAKVTVSEPVTAAGTYGDNLKWKLKNEVLTITGSGDMYDLSEDEMAPWYQYKDQIYDLVLPEGLTSIGVGAFEGCCYLMKVEIPEGVTRIGAGAFYECSSITKLTIPDSVTSIEDYAFYFCNGLRSPRLPKNLEHLGYSVFYETAYSNFETNWTGEILYLDGWVVDADESITSAQIRSGTKGIADGTFFGYEDLKKVTFPDDLKYIGMQSFVYTDLRSVTIPDNVTSIGEGAFYECSHLASVKLPAGITAIEPWTFSYNEKLKSIEIPANVTHIGEAAFYATGLTSITVANRECTIEEGEEKPAYMLGDPQKTTVYGYAGSPAQAYASKYGYRFTALSEKVPFIDVPSAAFYEDPVAWAVENEITKGVDESHFGPNQGCTRGQVVTFLWRAAGCPAPVVTTASTFTDIKPGAFYELAVAWAVEQGITNGMSPGKFAPDATCTRGQIVTFLWRFKGSPEPQNTDVPFTDLKPGGFYNKAVAWAVENKITNGMSPDKFAPDATCTRGQVVTFLQRATASAAPLE